MRKFSSPQADTAPNSVGEWRPNRFSCSSAIKAVLLPAAACGMLLGPLLPAQTPKAQTSAAQPPTTTTATPKTPVHHQRKRPSAAYPALATQPLEPISVALTPPAPEQPKWPAFDPAAHASVVWDSHGLHIDAANSSLQQILNEVALQTGLKVEGLTSDQRVFGAFGPGQPRDVLSQLLQGSGYNVIMIGDQGQGTPREVLLSTRQAANTQPAVRNNPVSSDDDAEPDDPPVQPEPQVVRPPLPPGAPPRSPQQFEMQQRQQQMQMQQQQQQANPQN